MEQVGVKHRRIMPCLPLYFCHSSAQAPNKSWGELTISGLRNSIYVPAPKALKILTLQLLFKLLEGTHLPRQCHLLQHPQTQDNTGFLFSRPQKPLFSHVRFQSNIAAFFLPAAFVPIPGRRE